MSVSLSIRWPLRLALKEKVREGSGRQPGVLVMKEVKWVVRLAFEAAVGSRAGQLDGQAGN